MQHNHFMYGYVTVINGRSLNYLEFEVDPLSPAISFAVYSG